MAPVPALDGVGEGLVGPVLVGLVDEIGRLPGFARVACERGGLGLPCRGSLGLGIGDVSLGP